MCEKVCQTEKIVENGGKRWKKERKKKKFSK
jgi:hypothetical protein